MTDIKPTSGLSKTTPIALFLVFLLPVTLATLLYFFHDSLPSPGTKNHGELIDPVRPLERFAAKTLEGKPLSIDYLRGKWTLIQIGENKCDLYCEASLFKTRQTRLAMGEDLTRVQRLYLLPIAYTGDYSQLLLREHPQMTVAWLQKEGQEDLLNTLGTQPEGNVYIIDPLGNVMMRYSKDSTAKGMIDDLRHLLKASRIGGIHIIPKRV